MLIRFMLSFCVAKLNDFAGSTISYKKAAKSKIAL